MATSSPSGYVPNVHHPEVMRSILAGIVETGDVIGTAGPGRTVLAVTVDNWVIDELAALGTDLEDREPERRGLAATSAGSSPGTAARATPAPRPPRTARR